MPSGLKKVRRVDDYIAHARRVYDAVHSEEHSFVYGVSDAGSIKVERASQGSAHRRDWLNNARAELMRGVAYYAYDGVSKSAFSGSQLASLVGCELVFSGISARCTGYAAANKQFSRALVRTEKHLGYYAEELMGLGALYRAPGAAQLYPCWNAVPAGILIT